ncbi:BREX-1 system adenine-specific DNA-methyltransferase PglX [Natroniella acetigena]|uniref:BREX-1 system adenine-specific DNA-methyltransferase PglX n=1 Tax=Natroniella acetigena TaxID=52004 RepID=UPI00200B6274|nr:BREX-1 system adenine-specific DNA-methyltransferase PglX [Natroniella acetigena]MCK8827428.1 BREX-1 system adenine-specific DNA-methyltransferase PglX [Natroniella acetigena]
MDKTGIKNFAVEARKKLFSQVKQQAFKIGIEEDKIVEPEIESSDSIRINEIYLNQEEKQQREELIKEIEEKDYEQVMEEVAYTWFNRLVALRYMEVNEYLPTGVRVLSSVDGSEADPDILQEVLNLPLNIDREKVYQYQDEGNRKGLYKYLLIQQCNSLHEIMPFIFQKINDYTEILLPDNLLTEGSIIKDLVTEIEEDDWLEGVEIIGWLYQFYISEKKDEVFASKKKISKEEIPAATQLFTPKWIVKYMVENSLGKLWLESNPNQDLEESWEYYLEEVEQEPEVEEELEEIRDRDIRPEEIKVLDPACGSGHILVYAFDVLYEIYQSVGYMKSEIPKLILENNLYGLDIDDRAGQLAYFAVMMKAREKNRRIFRNPIQLNICAIQESNSIGEFEKKMIKESGAENIAYLIDVFEDAKDYGSILDIEPIDEEAIQEEMEILKDKLGLSYTKIEDRLQKLIKQAKIMSQQYDIVVTNPPYMGSRNMNSKLKKYVRNNFKSSKRDLFAVFMERCIAYNENNGYIGMITMHSWMFLSSYEILRDKIINETTINSMVHLGSKAFKEIGGEVVQATSFIVKNCLIKKYNGSYFRLVDYNSSIEKKEKYLTKVNHYIFNSEKSSKIPGSPIAYWISDNLISVFEKGDSLGELADLKQGLSTSNNNKFLRLWTEVEFGDIAFVMNKKMAKESDLKWFPYNKGGTFRRWYGNNDYLINWENEGKEIKKFNKSVIRNEDYYFNKGITWSLISSSNFAARCFPEGMLFDVGSHSLFCKDNDYLFYAGLLNTKLVDEILKILNPTLNFSVGVIANIPVISNYSSEQLERINQLVGQNIEIAKKDWDSFETSWDFKRHLLLEYKENSTIIQKSFNNWNKVAEKRFYQLKENEEKLNQIFIEIYGLEDELTPEVDRKDVTVRKADTERDIKSFISYAVGCMMGRYSLDQEGLVYAGGEFDESKYQLFKPNEAGIIPICKDEYFEDDIVVRFIEFLKVTFGEENLEENLKFIADALPGRSSNARDRIRKYFLTKSRFYKDHTQRYNKRPIYWLFQSDSWGKAFNALIYLHRYDPGTVSKIRIDYLHELQKKLEAQKQRLDRVIGSDMSSTEKRKAKKKLNKIEKDLAELVEYDEKLNHVANQQIEIDLDDGVKENYPKFEDVLANM